MVGKGWDCNRIYGLFGGDSRELLARMESAHGEPIIDNGLAGARRVIGLLPCRSHLLHHPNRLRSQQSVVGGV